MLAASSRPAATLARDGWRRSRARAVLVAATCLATARLGHVVIVEDPHCRTACPVREPGYGRSRDRLLVRDEVRGESPHELLPVMPSVMSVVRLSTVTRLSSRDAASVPSSNWWASLCREARSRLALFWSRGTPPSRLDCRRGRASALRPREPPPQTEHLASVAAVTEFAPGLRVHDPSIYKDRGGSRGSGRAVPRPTRAEARLRHVRHRNPPVGW